MRFRLDVRISIEPAGDSAGCDASGSVGTPVRLLYTTRQLLMRRPFIVIVIAGSP